MHERGRRPTVLIADDHPLYREGLARAVSLRPDLELIGEATDGRTALEQIQQLAPDVAVLDMRMPGLRGLEVVEALSRDASPTRVLVLSAAVESSLVYAAVAAGAAGYWSKDAGRDAICDAIAAIARGEHVLDPTLQSGVFAEIHAREVDSERPVLTPREHEILNASPRASPRPRSAPSSTSAPRPSRPTSPTSTRSSASATAPPRSLKPCAEGSWNSEPCGLRSGRGQRERQRLAVGARPERLRRADVLLEGDRHRVVGDRCAPRRLGEGDLQRLAQRERPVGEIGR